MLWRKGVWVRCSPCVCNVAGRSRGYRNYGVQLWVVRVQLYLLMIKTWKAAERKRVLENLSGESTLAARREPTAESRSEMPSVMIKRTVYINTD